MPCPHFFPLRPLGPGPWELPPRLPLFEAWQGECRALVESSATPFQPPESEQRAFCNSGYARGQCPRFPENTAADAVRFSYSGPRLIYILEKDHAPIEHGNADGVDGILKAQAEAFRHSHSQLE